MKNIFTILSAVICSYCFTTKLKAQSVALLQEGKPCSIRGLAVLNDNVAWISASNGYIAITQNGGKDWRWQQLKGYEKADFRDIEVFSAREAIMISSGTPALVLKTVDAGLHWKEVYQNNDKAYFLDAMAFDDSKHGFILGDPLNGKFLLLETLDGGDTWHAFAHEPEAIPGEAAFAASGTCLRINKGGLNIITGGTRSRYLSLKLTKKSYQQWQAIVLPLLHGPSSQGGFSMAFGNHTAIFTGGDYQNLHRKDSVACYITRTDTTFIATTPPPGYQSCVEYVGADTFIATGTSGTNITTDGGRTWALIDHDSYNVCQKAHRGKLILLAGDQGRIAQIKNQ